MYAWQVRLRNKATARNRQARQSVAGGEHGEEAKFYAG